MAQIQGTLQGNVVEKLVYLDIDDVIKSSQTELKDEGSGNDATADSRGEHLLAILEHLSRDIDFSSADCYVSFPSVDLSFRNLTVPFKNRKKISQVLPFELEPVIPGSVDELTMDFVVLSNESEEEETQLVTAAVHTGLLTSFQSCLKSGGLNVLAILPGGSASAEYLIKACDSHTDYLFMDRDLNSATLFLIRNNEIAGIRSFMADDAQTLGLNISRTLLAYCEQNDMAYQPEMLFITGTGLNNAEAQQTLAETTGMTVESVDFLESMGFTLDESLGENTDNALYQGALSLAFSGIYGIKGLRLNERNVALNKYFAEYRDQIIQTGIFLCLVIVAFITSTAYDSISISKTIESYDKQMIAIYKETFPSATRINDPYAQMKGKLIEEKKRSAYADTNAGNIRVIDLLNDISKTLPDAMDIEFDRFVLGSDDLKISGTTDNYATVDGMKGRLEKIDYIKSVSITSTAGGKVENQVNFKLKIEF